VLTGVKPVGALVDELHEIAKDPAAARIIGQLRGGLLPNPEAFFCFITTQADQPPAGVFRSELMAARMTRDGKTKGATLPILYEFPADIVRSGAWRDPQNWWMVTPNRNRSVTIDRLVEDFKKAELSGESEVRRWASQHLNLEIGLALRSDRWAGADYWAACAESGLTLDAMIERCEILVIGIDGGGLDDLLGLAVLGREKETGKWLLWSHAWAAEIALDRRKSEAARYRDFERAGDLTIVASLGEDIKAIGDLVERLDESGKLAQTAAIGVDPVGIGQIIDELAARNIDPSRILGVPQGYKLNGAIKTVERALAEKSLCHAAQPLMAWAVSNAKVEPRGNAISITKQASGTAKIDPLMALFNAAALMAANPTFAGRSYLETDDLIVI
jgi:phage terminase large subunit-like protein